MHSNYLGIRAQRGGGPGRGGGTGQKYGKTPQATPSTRCQKCGQLGHWSFECTGQREYKVRPTRTQILKNPKLRKELEEAAPVRTEEIPKEGTAAAILAANEAKRQAKLKAQREEDQSGRSRRDRSASVSSSGSSGSYSSSYSGSSRSDSRSRSRSRSMIRSRSRSRGRKSRSASDSRSLGIEVEVARSVEEARPVAVVLELSVAEQEQGRWQESQQEYVKELPQAEIPDPAKYLARFDADDPVPSRKSEIAIFNLREKIGTGMGGKSAAEQLDETGTSLPAFGISEGLSTVEATDVYKEECCERIEEMLGASKVLCWNVIVRDVGSGQPDTNGLMQMKLEKAFAPTTNLKAVASFAHFDQDEYYARTIIKRAAGDDVFEKYSPPEIVNIWRPLLHGPVTNPLAVSDFSSMDLDKDVMRMAGSYDTAYSAGWAYLQHTQPNEAYLLRCYNSNMGMDGEALFTRHAACEMLNEPDPIGLEGKPKVPRRSVEGRMSVLYE
ncbi:hypothetical protein JCM10295v2_006690 [Rhodotorula toruloides]